MIKRFAWLAVCVLALAGCSTRPIYNVQKVSVVAPGRTASMTDVERAIVQAGTSLGWAMTPVRSGLVTGRLALRTHVAVVDVTYDTTSFSINYKDSVNLDASNGNIHKNYNGWVENLERQIRANLLKL